MKINLFIFIFLLVAFCCPVGAYQNLSVGLGGGYAGNLFADSFNIGNSYLVSNLSFASTNFQSAKLRLSYDIYYYEYDTGNHINNIFHAPGIALYRRNLGERFKWGVETFVAIKDYIGNNSGFDNFRVFSSADASFYISPGIQAKGIYKLIRSKYQNYPILDNYEHWATAELVTTLPSKTTMQGTARYSVRRFDEDQVTFHWIDTEFGLSQSLGIRTGLSFSFLRRWSGGGERPLSSYYIISGVTSYWDPWQGNQLDVALKRILPYAIISRTEGAYWKRQFRYDKFMKEQLSWLLNKTGRRDEGWLTKLELSRQYNLRWPAVESFTLNLRGGYISNGSDDSYYKYHYFFTDLNLNIRIF